MQYETMDIDGKGLTMREIEYELDELRQIDLSDANRQAYYMTSRYAMPAPEEDGPRPM